MNTALREREFLMCVERGRSGLRHTAPAIAFREQCRILGSLRTHADRRRTPIDVSDKAGGGLDRTLNGG